MHAIFQSNIRELSDLLTRLDPLSGPIVQAAQAMLECWRRGGKVLIAGNGGSAADAMHFAEELVVRFQKNRRALAAIALTDPTILSCCANDFGYDAVFTRQLEALGRPGDVFIAMTTSGDSPNIVAALKTARQLEMTTVSLLGKTGGQSKSLADIELLVPSHNTARIQEIHKLIFHSICQWIDNQV
jgi:D-sedoheptulose 7-phosphate isomerase